MALELLPFLANYGKSYSLGSICGITWHTSSMKNNLFSPLATTTTITYKSLLHLFLGRIFPLVDLCTGFVLFCQTGGGQFHRTVLYIFPTYNLKPLQNTYFIISVVYFSISSPLWFLTALIIRKSTKQWCYSVTVWAAAKVGCFQGHALCGQNAWSHLQKLLSWEKEPAKETSQTFSPDLHTPH